MSTSQWGTPPRLSIEAACRRYGRSAVVSACIDLLAGHDVGLDLLEALGGPGARHCAETPVNRYWLRVWGARGLLWAWDDTATSALVAAFGDEAWRVREMAAKVVARHLVGDATAAVAGLLDDPVPRVRTAAGRAVVALTSAGA